MNRREFIGLSLAGGALSLFSGRAFASALYAGGRPKTLVLGGGAFAMGYALAHPRETLILERGIHLGLDYAGTTGPVVPGTPTTDIGRELVAKMSEAGILKDGVMELPPLADFLAVFFMDHGGQAFMNADLVDLKKTPDGYLPPEVSSFARWTRFLSPPERTPTFFCCSGPRKLNLEQYALPFIIAVPARRTNSPPPVIAS